MIPEIECITVYNLSGSFSELNELDKSLYYQEVMVPGGGIEPPTRGFSIHCSTPELPGHG